MKVEATEIEGRKVYSVGAFNKGVATWLNRLPTLWIEGEVTELRRQQRWASVFFTLKDPDGGACLPVQMPRGQFDALELNLQEGEPDPTRPKNHHLASALPMLAESGCCSTKQQAVVN